MRVCRGRCRAAEEPLSQQGVRGRREEGGGGVTGHRLTERLLAGHSASEPGGSSTEQRLDEQSETEEQQLRSGGVRRRLRSSLPDFNASSAALSAALWGDNGVTVKVGEVPPVLLRRQPDSRQHEEKQLRETGECYRNRARPPAARDGPFSNVKPKLEEQKPQD